MDCQTHLTSHLPCWLHVPELSQTSRFNCEIKPSNTNKVSYIPERSVASSRSGKHLGIHSQLLKRLACRLGRVVLQWGVKRWIFEKFIALKSWSYSWKRLKWTIQTKTQPAWKADVPNAISPLHQQWVERCTSLHRAPCTHLVDVIHIGSHTWNEKVVL